MLNFKGNEDVGYALLNDLIQIIEDDKSYDLLDKYAILPNQNGEFMTTSKLYIDSDIPEEFK
jgi:hypothetical protein